MLIEYISVEIVPIDTAIRLSNVNWSVEFEKAIKNISEIVRIVMFAI
jgi:hypothetical protein